MSEDTTIGHPSRQAAMLLSELANLSTDELIQLNEIGLGIAHTFETVTANIENPPKKLSAGCQVIHLGSQLFLPIRELKQELDGGELDLEAYLRRLNAITDDLVEIVENNWSAMASKNVREHMRRLTNVIIVELEAGTILNALLSEETDDDDLA